MDEAAITVTIRYFAAARAAAGVAHELLTVPVIRPNGDQARPRPAAGTVASVLDTVADRHGAGLATLLRRCSFLLDEVAVHGRDTVVRDGQTLDVLPAFAGG